jgi:hypothetical protein
VRASWTCVDCGVTASFDPPRRQAVPDGWTKDDRGWLCLGCRREAVAATITVTNDGAGRSERRRALTEFELLRDPAASDGQIARRAHTSPAVVRPVRAEMREAGRLPAD